jgi:phage-related minor tail protein
VWLGVLSEIGQEMFRLAAINPLKNALFGTNAPTLDSIGGILGSAIGGMFGGGGAAASQPSTYANMDLSYFFAKGGAFSNGREIVPFATGAIVTGPTLFPMADGRTGLMGEDGEEGIMPLARTPSGHLGVRAISAPRSAAPEAAPAGPSYYIDARGSSDPGAVEAAVDRAMARRLPAAMKATKAGAVAEVRDQFSRGNWRRGM